MSLSSRLRDLRLKKGQSLQQVAAAIGVSKTHIWELEKGRADNPSIDMLEKLADHFGTTIRFLVGERYEADASDEQMSRMFRQVGQLTKRDKQILEEMIQSLKKNSKSEDDKN